ncbi:MAG: gamma carbonic anhydrase family protein [Nitrospinota bacterium]|nr:gamma carbonic anhydrase family protein [Nitrospinota bacterium]
MIRPWRGISPKIDPTAFVEQSAQIIGDVTMGAESSAWFNTTIRGDVHHIRIGARTNIQDGSVLHVTRDTHPLIIGDDVTVGHSVTLHGCTIEGPALIGMGAIILDGAVLEPYVFVAAGALVPEGMRVPSGSLVMGMPAKVKRPLTDEERIRIDRSATSYVTYRLDYMDGDG